MTALFSAATADVNKVPHSTLTLVISFIMYSRKRKSSTRYQGRYRRYPVANRRYSRAASSRYSRYKSRSSRTLSRYAPSNANMGAAFKQRTFKAFMDPSFMPADCAYVKLHYAYPLDIYSSLANNNFNTIYFSASSLTGFDNPSPQGTNQRYPMGLAKYQPQYHKYTVFASQITATFFNTDASNNAIVAIQPLKANDSIVSLHGNLDYPYTKWKVIGPGTGQSVATMKTYMSTSKLYGLPSGVDNADCNQMSFSLGSPDVTLGPNQWAWRLGFVPPATNPPVAGTLPNVSVRITWYVKFWDRRDIE